MAEKTITCKTEDLEKIRECLVKLNSMIVDKIDHNQKTMWMVLEAVKSVEKMEAQ